MVGVEAVRFALIDALWDNPDVVWDVESANIRMYKRHNMIHDIALARPIS